MEITITKKVDRTNNHHLVQLIQELDRAAGHQGPDLPTPEYIKENQPVRDYLVKLKDIEATMTDDGFDMLNLLIAMNAFSEQLEFGIERYFSKTL